MMGEDDKRFVGDDNGASFGVTRVVIGVWEVIELDSS